MDDVLAVSPQKSMPPTYSRYSTTDLTGKGDPTSTNMPRMPTLKGRERAMTTLIAQRPGTPPPASPLAYTTEPMLFDPRTPMAKPPIMINTGANPDAPLVLIPSTPSDLRAAVLGPMPTPTDSRHQLMAQMVSPAIFNSPVKRENDIAVPWTEPQLYDVEGDNDGEFMEKAELPDFEVAGALSPALQGVEDAEERSRIRSTRRASIVEEIGNLINQKESVTQLAGTSLGAFSIVGRAANRFKRSVPSLDARVQGLEEAAAPVPHRDFSFHKVAKHMNNAPAHPLAELSARRRWQRSAKAPAAAGSPEKCTFLGSCQCPDCR